MVVVTIEEAKKRLSELLTNVADGEEVVICQDSIPVGRLMPMPAEQSPKKPRTFGRFAGRIKIAEDFDAPLEDFAEYM